MDSSTTGANDVTANGDDDDDATMTMPRAVEESFIVPLSTVVIMMPLQSEFGMFRYSRQHRQKATSFSSLF